MGITFTPQAPRRRAPRLWSVAARQESPCEGMRVFLGESPVSERTTESARPITSDRRGAQAAVVGV